MIKKEISLMRACPEPFNPALENLRVLSIVEGLMALNKTERRLGGLG